jgi:serine/threonine protein kinase
MTTSALQHDTAPNSVERWTSLSGNILIVQTPKGEYAYWLQRKMSKTTRGSLRLGYRVTRLNDKKPSTWTVQPSTSGPYPHEMVAIKIQDRVACEHPSKANRDPFVEFSALQAMAREDPDGMNMVVTGIVCADTKHIFCIMPYFGEGSLAEYVVERGCLSEGVARHFFRQIIAGLCAMQHAGLCHHDLSLENILLRGTDCCIGGLGFAIRVPLDDNAPALLIPQQSCGTILLYLAPEILQNVPFDGFAVDLWAAGIMLAIMLFGIGFPFVWASPDDRRFREISLYGNLRGLARKWESHSHVTPVSEEALDLLQNMLHANPSDRLTIQEIQQHPWFVAEATPPDASMMIM